MVKVGVELRKVLDMVDSMGELGYSILVVEPIKSLKYTH